MSAFDPSTAKIACIGAGNVGRAWAIVFARAGYDVSLYDQDTAALKAAVDAIAENVADLERYELIQSAADLKNRISYDTDLDICLSQAIYIQESVSENIDVKREVFQQLDSATAQNVILASSTSELLPSSFFNAASRPERCIIAHPVNPPYLIPLVEICPGDATAQGVLETGKQILECAGMAPVVLAREIRGFLLNRLQAAVVGEALHLTGAGFCTPSDIEAVMTKGLGLRWAFIGPFMTSHLNASGGYKDYMKVFSDPYRRMIDDLKLQYPWKDGLFEEIEADLSRHIPAGAVSDGQSWRDRRLMALLKHLNTAEKFTVNLE
ncbi:MAG: 3-hydroxyacyl-CoA dehydrogenase [Pseudomonadota bacterium]